jgi:type I restriction enzyme, S subunit
MELNIDKTGWKSYRFDEFAQNISQRVEPKQTDLEIYVGLEHLDPDSLHIKRNGTPADVEGTKLKFYKGDVIFGKRRAYQRKAALAETDGICSAHAMVLRANTKLIDEQLFPFFFHSKVFQDIAVKISVGGLSPTINWKDLAKQEFLLPPKDQQARLAELLWAADEVVEMEREVKEGLEKTIQGYFESQLHKFNQEYKGYPFVSLSDICDISGGSTPLTTEKSFWNGNIPWLTPVELTNNKTFFIDDTKNKITEIGLKSISNKLYPPGTVMFTSRATIGSIAINTIPMATNQGFTNFKCSKCIENWYLLFTLTHNIDLIKKLATGSTFLEISKSTMRNLRLSLPNTNEQISIVNEIRGLYYTLNQINAQTLYSKQLKHGLTNEIF